MVGVALLRAFDKLFYLQFCDSSDRLKNIVQERFYQQFERYFYIKIIGTIIPTYLVRNFSPLFVLSQNQKKKKKRIKFSASWQFGNQVLFFALQRVAIFFKGMPNLADFYQGILLDFIPARIMVLCCERYFQIQFLVIYLVNTFLYLRCSGSTCSDCAESSDFVFVQFQQ